MCISERNTSNNLNENQHATTAPHRQITSSLAPDRCRRSRPRTTHRALRTRAAANVLSRRQTLFATPPSSLDTTTCSPTSDEQGARKGARRAQARRAQARRAAWANGTWLLPCCPPSGAFRLAPAVLAGAGGLRLIAWISASESAPSQNAPFFSRSGSILGSKPCFKTRVAHTRAREQRPSARLPRNQRQRRARASGARGKTPARVCGARHAVQSSSPENEKCLLVERTADCRPFCGRIPPPSRGHSRRPLLPLPCPPPLHLHLLPFPLPWSSPRLRARCRPASARPTTSCAPSAPPKRSAGLQGQRGSGGRDGRALPPRSQSLRPHSPALPSTAFVRPPPSPLHRLHPFIQALDEARVELKQVVDAVRRNGKSGVAHEQTVGAFADCLAAQAHAELARDDTSTLGTRRRRPLDSFPQLALNSRSVAKKRHRPGHAQGRPRQRRDQHAAQDIGPSRVPSPRAPRPRAPRQPADLVPCPAPFAAART